MEVSQAIHHHYYLYMRLSCPVPVYDQERMEEPWLELNENQFYQMFGYYKSQFIQIMNNLVLLPDKVQGHNSRAKAPMPMGICIMLRRWKIADTWEKVAEFFCVGRSWIIVIFKATVKLMCHHY